MVTETGSCLRPRDSCITQLKAPRPSGTCIESEEEEAGGGARARSHALPGLHSQTLKPRNDVLDANWLKRQKRFSVKAENRGVVVTKAGTDCRRIDSCIIQLNAQGPFGRETRVKKKKKKKEGAQVRDPTRFRGSNSKLSNPGTQTP